MIQLVRPTEAMKEQAIEFRQEFFEHGEQADIYRIDLRVM